jgi:hypothetical protein
VAEKSARRDEVKERLKAANLVRYVLLAAVGIAVVVGVIVSLAGHRSPRKQGGLSPVSSSNGGAADSAAHDDIRHFIESYFRDWSAGDMAAYKAHFDPSARIAFVTDGRVVDALDRDPFVAEQARLIGVSPVRMVERMTSFTVEADETAAHVTAGWELRKGPETSTGVDRFTLIHGPEGQWRIVHLLFYPRPAP